MGNEISEYQLNEESKEVAVSVVGYVAKTLSSRSDSNQCRGKLIFNNKGNGHDHDKYLRLLSRRGLTVASLALADFIFQTFSILHYISPTIYEMTKNKNTRKIAENVLPKHLNKVVNFTCVNHEDWDVTFSVRACINIFYNNEQKITNQSVRKDQIKDFKKRHKE